MRIAASNIKNKFRRDPAALSLVAAEIYMCLALGGVLLLGGMQRISSPAFLYIRTNVDWLPFDPNIVWGLAFLVAVLAQLVGILIDLRALVYAIRLSSVPFALWSILMAQAAQVPNASLTGVVMYSMGFVILWIISFVVAQTHKERQKEEIKALIQEVERRVLSERSSVVKPPNKSA